MALGDVDVKDQSVFLDGEPGLGQAAAQQPCACGQPLQFAHIGIRAFVNCFQAGLFEQAVKDRLAPELGPCRKELDHQHVRVPVHDQAGQAIGFGMDEPVGVGAFCRMPGNPHRYGCS